MFGEVGEDFPLCPRRHSINNNAEDDVAGCGLGQKLPGDCIRVAGSSGDEDPHIGGGKELPGKATVGLDNRVDIRGIQNGKPLGNSGTLDQFQAARAGLTCL